MVAVGAVLGERQPPDPAAASVYFRQAAELGDAEAQFALGQLYLRGALGPADGNEAAKWFKAAADQGFVAAYERLGAICAEGMGVERDYEAAAAWFHKAAAEGNAAALYSLGELHRAGLGVPKDAGTAADLFSRAARSGVAEAGVRLGAILAAGELGGGPDYRRAAMWWREAAQQGSLDAACNLALLCIRGQGEPQDKAMGLRLLEETAERGSRAAHWALHNLFSEGLDVDPDDQAAQAWLVKAAETGCGAAACKLALQLETHHPLAAPADLVLALLQRAAQGGETLAQEQLGRFYYEGIYAPQSMAGALRWFSAAAEGGAPFAQAWLGEMLNTGNGLPKDPTTALVWYGKAAEGGYLPALTILTEAALNASAPPETIEALLRHWRAAAERGDPLAQRMMGDFTLKGVGTEASTADAVGWLRKAADQGDRSAKVMLAGLYLKGQAEPRPGEDPIGMLREAAAEGDADAQYNLGVCYRQGMRVDVDLVQAETSFRQAAAAKHRSAQLALAELLASTPPDTLERAAEAAGWYGEAAQGGSGKAMHRLGQMHEHGRGVPLDLGRARQYYQSAAALGHAEARQAYQRLMGVQDPSSQAGRAANLFGRQ